VTADVTPFAVIQVKPGIGDVIWHLPFVRAIAAAAPDGQVTFFAPPTSAARDLLAAEPSVASTVYFQHAGSELQRGVNLIRLVALLRRHRPQSIWILDRTIRVMKALCGPSPSPIRSGMPASGRRSPRRCDLRLIEAAALLRLADLFVGPSSGPLNLAAAGGTDAFGLFGSTPVLTYSKFIRAIMPEGGPCPGGMARIAPSQVLERLAPYLSRRKASALTGNERSAALLRYAKPHTAEAFPCAGMTMARGSSAPAPHLPSDCASLRSIDTSRPTVTFTRSGCCGFQGDLLATSVAPGSSDQTEA
jgi:Glycosyltransferase family 9 (heptosyltransferase)